MQSKRINAVFFDLGDTLLNFGKVRTTPLFYRAAKSTYAFLKSQGHPVGGFTWYFIRHLIGLRWRYFVSNCKERDFNSLQVLRAMSERRGYRLSDGQAEQLSWHWYETLVKVAWVEPDLAQTLQTLADQGIKLGVISNTFVHASALDRHLEQLGLLSFFPIRLYSYQYPFRKPDPRLFQTAAEQMGEALEHILYVGDRIDKDLKPSLALGMSAALKRGRSSKGKPVPAGAWVIDRIAELPAMIEAHNDQCGVSGSVLSRHTK